MYAARRRVHLNPTPLDIKCVNTVFALNRHVHIQTVKRSWLLQKKKKMFTRFLLLSVSLINDVCPL